MISISWRLLKNQKSYSHLNKARSPRKWTEWDWSPKFWGVITFEPLGLRVQNFAHSHFSTTTTSNCNLSWKFDGEAFRFPISLGLTPVVSVIWSISEENPPKKPSFGENDEVVKPRRRSLYPTEELEELQKETEKEPTKELRKEPLVLQPTAQNLEEPSTDRAQLMTPNARKARLAALAAQVTVPFILLTYNKKLFKNCTFILEGRTWLKSA